MVAPRDVIVPRRIVFSDATYPLDTRIYSSAFVFWIRIPAVPFWVSLGVILRYTLALRIELHLSPTLSDFSQNIRALSNHIFGH